MAANFAKLPELLRAAPASKLLGQDVMAHFSEHRLDVVQVRAVQEKEIKGRQGDHNYRHIAEHGPIIEGWV
jgi:hypothetical protein